MISAIYECMMPLCSYGSHASRAIALEFSAPIPFDPPMDVIAQFLEQHAARDGLDIGAYLGMYTRLLSSYCERVFAFEPNPETAEKLKAGVSGLANVEVVQSAVSDRPGTATFYVDRRPEWGAVASSLYDLGIDGEQVQVDTMAIDQFCQGLDIGVMKIDAEGHESEIFSGAWQTIERCKPAIVFEVWERNWPRCQEAVDRLSRTHTLVNLQGNPMASGGDVGCVPI